MENIINMSKHYNTISDTTENGIRTMVGRLNLQNSTTFHVIIVNGDEVMEESVDLPASFFKAGDFGTPSEGEVINKAISEAKRIHDRKVERAKQEAAWAARKEWERTHAYGVL